MAKILIIDDERAIRSTLREILEYEDYEVEDIDNGIDGLELITKGRLRPGTVRYQNEPHGWHGSADRRLSSLNPICLLS